MRYRIELEHTSLGWLIAEPEPGESRQDCLRRAKEAVEDGDLALDWSDDSSYRVVRYYDADAACRLARDEPVRWCETHQEPLVEGLDICWRKSDDLAAENLDSQTKAWRESWWKR